MSIDSTAAVASEKMVAPTALGESAGFEERWAAWQARGAAHERAFRRKMTFAAPILIVVAVVLLYGVLGR
jgi:hypothetical protein